MTALHFGVLATLLSELRQAHQTSQGARGGVGRRCRQEGVAYEGLDGIGFVPAWYGLYKRLIRG